VIPGLGFAYLLADGFSMGASNVPSWRSDPALASSYCTRRATASRSSVDSRPSEYCRCWSTCFPVAVGGLLASFAIGSTRGLVANRGAVGALEMLVIGCGAAALAYVVGTSGPAPI
jgi:hypothetical protein